MFCLGNLLLTQVLRWTKITSPSNCLCPFSISDLSLLKFIPSSRGAQHIHHLFSLKIILNSIRTCKPMQGQEFGTQIVVSSKKYLLYITQSGPVYSHPPHFDLTEHSSLLAPQVLSTLVHLYLPLTSPSTSLHISHLSTCDPSLHSISILLLEQPLILLSTPLCFFPKPSCPSQPIPLPHPPTSISLPLPKTLLSPL